MGFLSWAKHRCSAQLQLEQTCGSFSSSVHDKATTPGLTKQARLSTWPLVMASSPAMPFHSQMIFFKPRYSFRAASIPFRPKAGFLLGWSRHSSVQIRVLHSKDEDEGVGKKLNDSDRESVQREELLY